MLDLRMETFLCVCNTKNYSRAAEELCITQPAVTQHIQYLERHYGCKFFQYSNRELRLTEAGELFYKYAINAKASEKAISDKLSEINKEIKKVSFAATLTIGEFTLAPILADFIKIFNKYNVTMYVDNTETVLKMLHEGEISFALVEGLFNRADYQTRLLKTASFILIAPINHSLVNKESISLEDLKDETIIMREKGSGSREILERGLFEKNYTLDHFKNIIEVGNVNVIKNMVKRGIGLSFMYKDAALKQIEEGLLAEIKISDFVLEREFNFINLKNNIAQSEIDMFFSFFHHRVSNFTKSIDSHVT
jgi:DNA-binding transcriptional LysR family regulator